MQEAVIGITFNSQRDQVLVVKRRDVSVWALPGGGVDNGESPEEAVVREIFEESGVKVFIKRKVAELFPINRLGGHTHLFECVVIEGTPQITEETRGAGFYPITKLPKLFFYIHENWIQETLQDSPFKKRSLTELTYWSLFKFLIVHPIHTIRFLFSKLGLPLNS